MSLPISICMIYKAAQDDAAYEGLVERMKINLKHGAFSTWPCTHQPLCVPPAPAELDRLTERLSKDLQS